MRLVPMKTVEERLSQHDKEIAAIRKLVLTGMKMFVRLEGQQVAFREDMRKLAATQRVTEQKLQGLIQSLTRSGNGKH